MSLTMRSGLALAAALVVLVAPACGGRGETPAAPSTAPSSSAPPAWQSALPCSPCAFLASRAVPSSSVLVVLAGTSDAEASAYLVRDGSVVASEPVHEMGFASTFPDGRRFVTDRGHVLFHVAAASAEFTYSVSASPARIWGPYMDTVQDDPDGDGVLDVVERINDCRPDCADGTITNHRHVWTGRAYT
jgi:hypothetical protein